MSQEKNLCADADQHLHDQLRCVEELLHLHDVTKEKDQPVQHFAMEKVVLPVNRPYQTLVRTIFFLLICCSFVIPSDLHVCTCITLKKFIFRFFLFLQAVYLKLLPKIHSSQSCSQPTYSVSPLLCQVC